METYKERIKALMSEKGVGVAPFAKVLGVTYQAVRNMLESNGAFGSVNNLKAAEYFGVDPNWLATGKGQRTAPMQAPAIPYAGPTNLGRELALVFDMIPEGDTLKRSKAYALATAAIVATLEGEDVTLQRVQDK